MRNIKWSLAARAMSLPADLPLMLVETFIEGRWCVQKTNGVLKAQITDRMNEKIYTPFQAARGRGPLLPCRRDRRDAIPAEVGENSSRGVLHVCTSFAPTGLRSSKNLEVLHIYANGKNRISGTQQPKDTIVKMWFF